MLGLVSFYAPVAELVFQSSSFKVLWRKSNQVSKYQKIRTNLYRCIQLFDCFDLESNCGGFCRLLTFISINL